MRKLIISLVAIVSFLGCVGPDRQNIRNGILITRQPQDAFLKEWGRPSKTYSEPVEGEKSGTGGSFSFGPGGGGGSFYSGPRGTVFDVWFYREKKVTLLFSRARLVAWFWGEEPALVHQQP
jgi:hypothetical protein